VNPGGRANSVLGGQSAMEYDVGNDYPQKGRDSDGDRNRLF
jgi:hypothetical protein